MLLDYDTIILDLDFTIWNGCKPLFWARLLEPPYKIDSGEGNRFYGANSEYIELHDGIEYVLRILQKNKKNIGFASRGASDNVPFEKQPSVIALKSFGIYDYFNYQQILVFRTVDKTQLLKPMGKTIYIDDNQDELDKVFAAHSNKISCIRRDKFNKWRSIL